MKQKMLLLASLFFSFCSFAQCLSVPSFPDCTGSEPLLTSSDNITVNQARYFYGSSATLSDVKLSGGTLIVCGDLTLNNFLFDSGILVIKTNATLVVTNGAGLVVRGNTSVYNSGIFQCNGNYVMDGSYATALKPNLFVNALGSSMLKMQSQYFVINNPYSKLVNNGFAEFHGLITDPPAATGSVCLGSNSQMKMTVLYNKAKHPYVAPSGPACVSVSQYSQFYDTLTLSPNINFCLGPLHTSDATCVPWGCKPNAWGNGHMTANCTNCYSLLSVLSSSFIKIEGTAHPGFNEINWQMAAFSGNELHIQRSRDGLNFLTIATLKADNKTQYQFEDHLLEPVSYYKVVSQGVSKNNSSEIIKIERRSAVKEIYPNPFRETVTIPLNNLHTNNVSVSITDILGRKIVPAATSINDHKIILDLGSITKGVYLISVSAGKEQHVFKVLKNN